jgi:hypothetical protein
MILRQFIRRTPLVFIFVYLRYSYNRFFVQKAFHKFLLLNKVEICPIVEDGISFFGYYNIRPDNRNGELLYLRVSKEVTRGSLYEPASIMRRSEDGSCRQIGLTASWNWQQGCMLQWVPGKWNKIIFNDYHIENDNYITKVIDENGEILKTYQRPVNNLCANGMFALSLDYDLLAEMRPDYGYFNRREVFYGEDKEVGIWHINLNNGQIKLIVSLYLLKKLAIVPSMLEARHKVNHIDINPSGTHFIFLHRWKGPNGRFTRLILSSADGSEIKILNGDIMTSHCCWLNDFEILAYCNFKGKVGYFKFDCRTEGVDCLSDYLPAVDGHPSVSPNGKWVVLDTYPNKARFSSLFLYNIESKKLNKLGEFHQPLKYTKEMRVDLHPKWSVSGEAIYFESAHRECRKLYRLSNLF